MTTKSILVAAVPYSPNLGDGLLARCVDHAINVIDDGRTTVDFIDLAGRTEFAPTATTSEGRGRLLTTLGSLPRPIGDAVGGTGAYVTTARKFRHEATASALAMNRPLIIGGGHLLSDEYLNFPAKVALLGRHASGRPAIALGVGADANPSRAARYLFARAFNQLDLRMVVARDEVTADVVRSITPDVEILVAPDLGVLSSRLFASPASPAFDVGFSVASPASSHYHVGNHANPSVQLDWWCTLLGSIAEDRRVLLFSNGSPEDEAFKQQIADRISGSGIEVAATPQSFEDLLALLTASERLVAQRLHAILPATVAGIPTLAVDPNPKVRAVMATAGLKLHDASTSTSTDLATIEGVPAADAPRIESAVDRCLSAVQAGLEALNR